MTRMKVRTSSEARSEWRGKIIHGHDTVEVIVDGKPVSGVQCPPLESLERRHAASDESWTDDWLKDEVDPTQPE